MTTTQKPARQPAGVPTGGQFSHSARPESDAELAGPAAQPQMMTATTFRDLGHTMERVETTFDPTSLSKETREVFRGAQSTGLAFAIREQVPDAEVYLISQHGDAIAETEFEASWEDCVHTVAELPDGTIVDAEGTTSDMDAYLETWEDAYGGELTPWWQEPETVARLSAACESGTVEETPEFRISGLASQNTDAARIFAAALLEHEGVARR